MKKIELISNLIKIGSLFRTAQEGEANALYATCVNSLLSHGTSITNQEGYLHVMKNTLAAQERQDWIAFADYVEYELPLLLNEHKV